MTSHDLEYLASLVQGMESQYPGSKAWDDSPFKWVLAQPSATKGSISRRLVTGWANLYGMFPQQLTIKNQIYLDFGGTLVQVKFSTLWDTGYYRFQQIRQGDYDYCLCLGLSPFDMHAWLIPKSDLDIFVIGTKGQHTGTGSGETWWLEASPRNMEPWLEEFGGQLDSVAQRFQEIGGQRSLGH
ncbi:hypothetical protein LJ753_06020 [Arthrobacter sp. zg-Y20]|uniref:hypothetical protein n=1 Tax=unclassified Arthrobacter TaxID=235627 RepID=UPI001D148FCB|nr:MULTISPECIES: hypothetical protein [unclassified Arthrobacter]MCC3275425.1 hypothetical protein [Arthrobacter sp. zg-Y20]MDK1315582.1 hypothetical protein [Arthrobacter sp. zg.Y20]WIB05997.1 hypothetical protein QNO06_15995 [Arthrobacter sp. zg-Y20]